MHWQTNEDKLCMGDERGSRCGKENTDRRQKSRAGEMKRTKEENV